MTTDTAAEATQQLVDYFATFTAMVEGDDDFVLNKADEIDFPIDTFRSDVSQDIYMINGIMPTRMGAKPMSCPQTARGFFHQGQGGGEGPLPKPSSKVDQILEDQIREEEEEEEKEKEKEAHESKEEKKKEKRKYKSGVRYRQHAENTTARSDLDAYSTTSSQYGDFFSG